jgi:transketolase
MKILSKKLKINEMKKLCQSFRKEIIDMIYNAKSGHVAGPLGAIEQYVALYFGDVLKYNPKNPKWEKRDRVVISNGHYAPLIYLVLAEAGFFDKQILKTFRNFESILQGHPNKKTPGIETSSGPVGEGLAQAIGMCLASKLDKNPFQVYCLMGDGEQQEGSTWEAVMFAAKYKLDNLICLIDRNQIQIDGHTEDVMPIEPLKAKYESFNWNAIEVDGHNLKEIINAINQAKFINDNPTVIICNTLAGKGISFIENKPEWHGKSISDDVYQKIQNELNN